MKRLALTLALLGGCGTIAQHPGASGIVYVAASAAAMTCAIECSPGPSDVSIGVLSLSTVAIPIVIFMAIMSQWGTK